MCSIIGQSSHSHATGYKVVLKDEKGDYYSAAMGCKYPKRGYVKPVYLQERITSYFHTAILQSHFSADMVGRTAIFVNLCDAENMALSMRKYTVGTNWKVAILSMKLCKELVIGYYGREPIIAGKYIESIREISCV